MTNTSALTIIVPSWEGLEDISDNTPSFTVSPIGAVQEIDGGTYIKKNVIPASGDDYDVMCDSHGNLSGKYPLTNVTSIYIWGYGYTLNGLYYDCEPVHDDATKIEIAEDTEIILWGANSKP